MKVFLFGTFNPPTNAHIQMGIMAWKALGKECEIIYIPASDRYVRGWKNYKDGSVMPGSMRASLLAEAVRPYGFSVSGVEVDGKVDGKTYNTLEYLGDSDSVLCIGADNVNQMEKWYRYEDLLSRYRLLIFDRDGYLALTDTIRLCAKYTIVHLDKSCDGISSTQVRDLYTKRELEKVKEMVPPNVFRYLSENRDIYF